MHHFIWHPQRHWFYEYEEIEGGYVLLGKYSPKMIIGWGKVRLILKYGRRRTLQGLLHIPILERNLISIIKRSDASVKYVFEKDTCNMVWSAVVLMRGIKIGTLYKLLGRTNESSCLLVVDPKTDKILSCVVSSTMLWYWWLRHIGKKGIHSMHSKGIVKGLLHCSSNFDLYEHFIYGK